MLANFVKETASAPGTSTTFNLGGATAPFVTFAASFANGATCLYVMYSTTQAEWGVGTVTHGSPNTLSRTTVAGNTAGTTAKLNFTGTTTVICAPIAEKAVYLNAADSVILGGAASVARLSVKHDGTTAPISTEVAGTSSLLAIGFLNGNGLVGAISTNGSATAYNTSSDYRLKVTYGQADGSMIQRLRVHDAAFLSDGARYPMFIAHEMQEDGAGFAVRGEKDGLEMQGVDHSKLVPALVAYAQQLRADLDAALARLTAIGA